MKYGIILLYLICSIPFYSFVYKVDKPINNSLLESTSYFSDMLYDVTSQFLLSSGNSVLSNEDEKYDYQIETSYFADQTKIYILSTIYNNKKEYYASDSITLNLNDNIISAIRIFILNLNSESLSDDLTKPTQLKISAKKELFNKIKNNSPEYMFSFSIGAVYAGMGFNPINSYSDSLIQIDSPANRWRDYFSPTIRFESSQKFALAMHGFYFDVIIPLYIETPGFFSYSKVAVGYTGLFYKMFEVAVGVESLFLNYNKFSRENKESFDVMLITFGLSTDFTIYLLQNHFAIKSGFSIYPPFTFMKDIDMPLFSFTINNRLDRNFIMVPISPRIGLTIFNKEKDLGFFMNYSISIFSTDYLSEYLERYYGPSIGYPGSENGFVHEIKVGIVYKTITK